MQTAKASRRGHPHSLIRAFAVHLQIRLVLYNMSVGSEGPDAQSDLGIHCPQKYRSNIFAWPGYTHLEDYQTSNNGERRSIVYKLRY